MTKLRTKVGQATASLTLCVMASAAIFTPGVSARSVQSHHSHVSARSIQSHQSHQQQHKRVKQKGFPHIKITIINTPTNIACSSGSGGSGTGGTGSGAGGSIDSGTGGSCTGPFATSLTLGTPILLRPTGAILSTGTTSLQVAATCPSGMTLRGGIFSGLPSGVTGAAGVSDGNLLVTLNNTTGSPITLTSPIFVIPTCS